MSYVESYAYNHVVVYTRGSSWKLSVSWVWLGNRVLLGCRSADAILKVL